MTAGSRLLTDELRAWVGREAAYTAPEELGRASIRYYALALGDENPLYRDEEFARGSRFGGIVAPPTLICETNQLYPARAAGQGYIGHLWELPLPIPCRLLRGGNQYEFLQPVRPDDRLSVTWRLVELREQPTRSRGLVLLVVSEARYHNQRREPLAVNRETVIYQPVEPVPVEAPAAGEREEEATTAGGEELPPLEVAITLPVLVAYAGATWDWHPYHYDQQLAREAGLPGPFVDGQMWGGLLARLALAWAGRDAWLRRLWLRYRSLLFCGETARCRGWVAAREERKGCTLIRCSLRVEAGDGRVVVDGAGAEVELPR